MVARRCPLIRRFAMRKPIFLTAAAVALTVVACSGESAKAQVIVSTPAFYGAYNPYPYPYAAPYAYPYYGVNTPYVGVGIGAYPYYSGYRYPTYNGGTRYYGAYRGGYRGGMVGGFRGGVRGRR
jgi:hypothetical protein